MYHDIIDLLTLDYCRKSLPDDACYLPFKRSFGLFIIVILGPHSLHFKQPSDRNFGFTGIPASVAVLGRSNLPAGHVISIQTPINSGPPANRGI